MPRQHRGGAQPLRAGGGFVAAVSLGLALASLIMAPPRAWAYTFTGTAWSTSPVVMHLQLGASPGPLLDGSVSWGASAEAALRLWNTHLQRVSFSPVPDSTASRVEGNRQNNVFFAPDIYGDAWGSGVLAVALTYSSGGRTVESDVLFNSGLSWNSYRGPQRYTSFGTVLFDFQRVALHEFGHVLGLDHPDQAGQFVTALMNSRISSLDTLASDDIAGGQALYGTPAPTLAPPTITSQPVSQSVAAGQSVSFTVTATSTTAMGYQWLKGGAALGGATHATLTLAHVTAADAGTYAVRVMNSGGSVTSAPATLTVSTPTLAAPAPPPPPAPAVAPFITSPPSSQVVAAGARVVFSVSAGGTAPIAYQWRKAGMPIPGATAPSHVIAAAQPGDAGTYTAVVSNSAGAITSAGATLSLHAPPVITSEPVSQAIVAGQPLTLSVVATGTPAPVYQWEKDGGTVPGATSSALVLGSVQATDAGNYQVRVGNLAGSIISAIAKVAVVVPPRFVTQPADQTVRAGLPAALSVEVTGTPELRYQWSKDGNAVAGATAAKLTMPVTQPADAGTYRVVVTNAAGSAMSAGARVAVNFSRLVNLSTRGYIAPGGTLTPGFVIRGVGAKQLIVRGVGPALRQFGVEDALAATALQLTPLAAVQPVLAAESWGNRSELASAFAGVGAFPLPAGSADAAAQAALPADAYTVQVSSSDPDAGGIALAELYDADALSSPVRLVNASTLGFAGTGAQVLTPGFVIRGNVSKRLLIRAIGPGLEAFGVVDRLDDPQLAVVPAGAAAPLTANDDWGGDNSLQQAFAQVGAFRLDPASRDAAAVVELPPGAYTVVISGADGLVGTALVEIYDLDP